MNGAIYDSTWNVFFKMHFGKLYEGMLVDLARAARCRARRDPRSRCCAALLYAAGFLIIMQIARAQPRRGRRSSRCPPCCSSRSGSRASAWAITSYMKTFQQMDWINFVLLPMFLFSATFYPITVYPESIQWLVQALPLWHGVELVRLLTRRVHPGHGHAHRLLPRDDRGRPAVHDPAAAQGLFLK